MKKIILIVFLTFGMLSYSQVNDSIPSKISETERIVDKYSDKIYTVVQELAKSLSVPAEYVYKVLVKQSVVESITWLVLFIISIILMIPFIKMSSIIYDWDNMTDKYNNDKSGSLIPSLLSLIIGIIIFILALFNINIIIQGFVNPEYKAIETIINAIK